MNYSEPLISQITVFCRAVGCGVLLGIVYCVFSLARMTLGERKSIYVLFDTVYFLFASVISFFFMVLYNSGQARFNLMLAELFGAVSFHFSFGRYILDRYALNLNRVRRLVRFLTRPFVRAGKKIYSFFHGRLSEMCKRHSVAGNKEKIFKKISDIRKFLLKNKYKSV